MNLICKVVKQQLFVKLSSPDIFPIFLVAITPGREFMKYPG